MVCVKVVTIVAREIERKSVLRRWTSAIGTTRLGWKVVDGQAVVVGDGRLWVNICRFGRRGWRRIWVSNCDYWRNWRRGERLKGMEKAAGVLRIMSLKQIRFCDTTFAENAGTVWVGMGSCRLWYRSGDCDRDGGDRNHRPLRNSSDHDVVLPMCQKLTTFCVPLCTGRLPSCKINVIFRNLLTRKLSQLMHRL